MEIWPFKVPHLYPHSPGVPHGEFGRKFSAHKNSVFYRMGISSFATLHGLKDDQVIEYVPGGLNFACYIMVLLDIETKLLGNHYTKMSLMP